MKTPLFHIVLLEPEIPSNTGNIGRICVGLNSELHLIEPLGFELTDKQLKRAGLDYWPFLKWHLHKNFEIWWEQVENSDRVFFFTTKVKKPFFEVPFQQGDWLVFGKETKGLPENLLKKHKKQTVTLPRFGPVRSYNLSNAVAMALSEGVRQLSQRS